MKSSIPQNYHCVHPLFATTPSLHTHHYCESEKSPASGMYTMTHIKLSKLYECSMYVHTQVSMKNTYHLAGIFYGGPIFAIFAVDSQL